MRDRGAERALSRLGRVDVDPLVVAGGVGELVDPLLGDLQPLRGAEIGPDGVQQGVRVLEDGRHAGEPTRIP